MCGIAGFCLSSKDAGCNTTRMARAGLAGIQDRGRDACGVGYWTKDGVNVRRKLGKVNRLDKLLTNVGRGPVILHTRLATHGSADDVNNAHPHTSGPITLTHNGMIWNAADILPKVARRTPVDTEAAAILLHHKTWEQLGDLDGSAALAWLDNRHRRTLFLARLSGSPLVLGTTEYGSTLYASTHAAVEAMAKAAKVTLTKVESVPSFTYLTIVAGKVTYRAPITEVVHGGRYYGGGRYTWAAAPTVRPLDKTEPEADGGDEWRDLAQALDADEEWMREYEAWHAERAISKRARMLAERRMEKF